MTSRPDLVAQAQRLRDLHEGFLVLPNAWDAASAKSIAGLGFPAVATTSSGVAASLGYGDAEGAPVDEMFAATARIAHSVDVPVTADAESGYGLTADQLVGRLLDAGASGLNIEDSDHSRGGALLVDADAHAARLAAIKQAARASGVDVVLNARIDTHLRHLGTTEEQTAEGLRRARIYLAAGADCVYPIFVQGEDAIHRYVELGAPVNVIFDPAGLSLTELKALGVRRVSFGGRLQALTDAHLGDLLRDWGAVPNRD